MQTHPQVTMSMDNKFNVYIQKWLLKSCSDLQRLTISDWLLGRNQNDFVSCKTTVKKDNNISETPYRVYNRYKVDYTTSNENIVK